MPDFEEALTDGDAEILKLALSLQQKVTHPNVHWALLNTSEEVVNRFEIIVDEFPQRYVGIASFPVQRYSGNNLREGCSMIPHRRSFVHMEVVFWDKGPVVAKLEAEIILKYSDKLENRYKSKEGEKNMPMSLYFCYNTLAEAEEYRRSHRKRFMEKHCEVVKKIRRQGF